MAHTIKVLVSEKGLNGYEAKISLKRKQRKPLPPGLRLCGYPQHFEMDLPDNWEVQKGYQLQKELVEYVSRHLVVKGARRPIRWDVIVVDGRNPQGAGSGVYWGEHFMGYFD